MKKPAVVVLVLLLLCGLDLNAFGIPVFDLNRITSLIAQHLPIKEWWDRYNQEFEGGDGVRGLIKFDQLLLVNIWGNLEGLGQKRYEEMFSDEWKEFLQTVLDGDYFERFLTDAVKAVFREIEGEDYHKDVMGEEVLRGNVYYRENRGLREKVDQALRLKAEIHDSVAAMARDFTMRSRADQEDLDRFEAVCDYIDEIDKGDDDPFGFLAFGKAVNQHELVMILLALQNEEIQVNRSLLETLRSLHELDVYRELEKLHEF